MNHRFNLAQGCSFKYETRIVNDKEVRDVIVKPATYKPPILLDELLVSENFQECVCYHVLDKPLGGYFESVWKAIDNVESYHPYEYYLVAYDIGLKELFKLIKQQLIWPEFRDRVTGRVTALLPAFSDNEPRNSERFCTYDDTHVIIGNKPWNVKMIKRKD
jgi:hypothetical protein